MQLEITDDQAVESLIWFSTKHRASIGDWALKTFATATSVADKASLAVEVFEKFVAAVEDLEMLYFALQQRAKDASKSFLFQYADIFIKEEGKDGKQKETSAAEILRQLEAMDDEGFRTTLGLPTVEEFHRIHRRGEGTLAEAEAAYKKYLGDLRRATTQAVKNRATLEVMKTYNKIKHGFVVMHHPKDGLFMVREVQSKDGSKSIIEGTPYEVKQESLQTLVNNTKEISKLCGQLLMLHFRRTE